jgi:hypothetical protein
MTAPDDIETRMFAALTRVLEQAPIERKLGVLTLIGREAAACANIRRQRLFDDCQWLAEQTGLIAIVGAVTVTDTLMAAFEGDR